ncbi:MAG: carbamoyltransferase HypF [Thermoproteota archaeon]
MAKSSVDILVRGIVQGVGFRPFVFRLAKELNLNGYVTNSGEGVEIHLEGEESSINEFILRLKRDKPSIARIDEIVEKDSTPMNLSSFQVIASKETKVFTIPPPDIAICNDCKNELLNKYNRRYLYPLISCMNCGPRFTIIKSLPYDRSRTTLSKFKLCKDCEAEYFDPINRRFRAEPISCWVCGPKVFFVEDGKIVKSDDPIMIAAELINKGEIVAIKGIGGFHLAADATNDATLKKLRALKNRHFKPFAVMVKNIDFARKVAYLSEEEERILLGQEAPIVLAKKKEDSPISELVSPKINTIGIFLPYTGIHVLLLEKTSSPYLVMTSANPKDEVISYKNSDAMKKLSSFTSHFLIHNRDIYNFADDSVVRVIDGLSILVRRSRGYVPIPIPTPVNVDKVFGIGGDLKNTFAIGKEKEVFISQHIGDLSSYSTQRELKNSIRKFLRLIAQDIKVIALDMHPNYYSRKVAESMKTDMKVEVQHHHAHIAATLASNNLNEDVIGVACDGTGYGADGNIWGFEFLLSNLKSFNRLAHMKYFRLPGGDKAIIEPRRFAFSLLYDILDKESLFKFDLGFSEKEKEFLYAMIKSGTNSPLVSSCGRLFDGISALLGVCLFSTYDGEAAMELESIADENEEDSYSYDISFNGSEIVLDPSNLVVGVINDLKSNAPKSKISARFHNTVVKAISELSIYLADEYKLKRVVLSGGSFLNEILVKGVRKNLMSKGINVILPRGVSVNDSCLSLGQVVVASSEVD